MVASNEDKDIPLRPKAQGYVASRYKPQIEDTVFEKLAVWLEHKKYKNLGKEATRIQFKKHVGDLVSAVCDAHQKESGGASGRIVAPSPELLSARANLAEFLKKEILVDAFPIPTEKVISVLERYTHELILHPGRMMSTDSPSR